jgi:hypothetical protein
MRVHLFVTESEGGRSVGPVQYVPDSSAAFLRAHPRGLEWRYFATLGLGDALLSSEPEATFEALREGRSVVSRRLAMRSLADA